MEQEIKLLQIVSTTLVVLLICLLIYLIIRKAVENRQLERVKGRKKQLVLPVFEYLRDGKEISETVNRSRIDKQAIEQVLTDFAERIEGEQEEERLHELAVFYLKANYVKEMKARNWSKRMNVLYKIEDFHMREMERNVINHLQNRKCTVEEKIQIYRILAVFQYEKIWTMMDEDKSLSEKNYRSILLRLKPEMFEEFIRPFYYCREELQLAILDVISMKKEIDYLVFLESIFEKYDGEIKLRALKAISSIGYVRNIEEYLFLTKSKKWQERMMIAKLLGSYEEQHLYLLITLLHDSSWWVRSQAAESIISFKKGRAILLEIIKHSKDTFAQDMAREWLNKGVN